MFKITRIQAAHRDWFFQPGKYSGKTLVRSPLGMSIKDTAIALCDDLNDDLPLPDYNRDELLASIEAALVGVNLQMITLAGDRSVIPAKDMTEAQASFIDDNVCLWVLLEWEMFKACFRVTFDVSCWSQGLSEERLQSIVTSYAESMVDSIKEDMEISVSNVRLAVDLMNNAS